MNQNPYDVISASNHEEVFDKILKRSGLIEAMRKQVAAMNQPADLTLWIAWAGYVHVIGKVMSEMLEPTMEIDESVLW